MNRIPILPLPLLLAACASAVPDPGVRWEPVVAWQGEAAFERIRAGRPDAADPRLEVIGVDQAGEVVRVRFEDGGPRSEVIYRHGSELTGLVVADIDPAIPGEEIYVGGYDGGTGREGTGGAVLQVALGPGEPATRRIYAGGAYVHSLERFEPGRLLVSTYAGEVHVLTPAAGGGPWDDRLVHREPPNADPEALKVKDAAFLRDPSGRPPHEVLLALKTGRAVLLDLERPGSARLVHDEEGGLSRVTADPDGGAWVTGYFGRVLHFVRAGDGLRVEVADQEGKDSGLRGFVFGRLPLPGGGTADRAIFGFDALCRALVPRCGAWDPVTLFRDVERGHTLEAADLVPGNDADELVLGGYSNRITVLVATRGP